MRFLFIENRYVNRVLKRGRNSVAQAPVGKAGDPKYNSIPRVKSML